MKSIQNYLPNPHHAESKRIFVNAKPQDAWQLALHYDLSTVPWVRFLFNLRTIADFFKGHKNGDEDTRIGLDQIAEHGKGFMILHKTEGREVVVGAIGKFWHLDIPFVDTTPGTFKNYDEEGWGKVAWSITVDPYRDGSTICFDLRTSATDEESWKKLNLYYHIIGSFSKLIRYTLMNRLEKELDKMIIPAIQNLPGDEIIAEARYTDDDHIVIEAPVHMVWRYLMQLGCDRAGWYSIDLLDNAGRKSTDHIVEEWEDRKVGDKLSATPRKDSFFEVYQIEKNVHFVLGGKAITGNNYFNITWAFLLEPIGTDATLLVTRAKMTMSPMWKEWIMGNVIYPPVHGLMELVQLKTIKAYAERDARSIYQTGVKMEKV